MGEQRVIRPHEQVRGSRRTPLVRIVGWGPDGTIVTAPIEAKDMSLPARCTCGAVYDVGHVTVTKRYADCSVWNAPCCGREADSRRAWSNAPGEHMGYTDLREQSREMNERRKR